MPHTLLSNKYKCNSCAILQVDLWGGGGSYKIEPVCVRLLAASVQAQGAIGRFPIDISMRQFFFFLFFHKKNEKTQFSSLINVCGGGGRPGSAHTLHSTIFSSPAFRRPLARIFFFFFVKRTTKHSIYIAWNSWRRNAI